jgi:hypothetical protein
MKLKGSTWQPADPCDHYYRLPGQRVWWMWLRPRYIRAHQALLSERLADLDHLEALVVNAASNSDADLLVVPDPMPAPPPLASARTSQAPPRRPAPSSRVTEMSTT